MANCNSIDSAITNVLSLSTHYLEICDRSDFFYKKLEALRDIVQTRKNIFSQKKEIYQNLMNFKINKIEKKKESCQKKAEEMAKKIEESTAHLNSLNYNFSELGVKKKKEIHLNKVLTDKISRLQLGAQQEELEFFNTLKNYETILMWYENFLGFDLDFEKEKSEIIYIYVKTSKNIKKHPQIIIKILDNEKYQVVKMHSSVQESFGCIISKPELTLLLCKVLQHSAN